MAIESIITILAAGFLGVVALVLLVSWVMYKVSGGGRLVPAAAAASSDAHLYKIIVKPHESEREPLRETANADYSASQRTATHDYSSGTFSGSGTFTTRDDKPAPPRLQVVQSTGERTFSQSRVESKYGYTGNQKIYAGRA